MALFTGHKTALRWLILALLIAAMLGPWGFDLLNVPAQYACEKPSVRLYGDFCGYPISGFSGFAILFAGFFYMLGELRWENIAPLLPGILSLLFVCVIAFPFLNTLLLLWRKTSRRLQIQNLVVWGLAGLASLALFSFQFQREQFLQFFYTLWGILLYILVAIGALIFEVQALRPSARQSQIV
jgi:hypothetical protein